MNNATNTKNLTIFFILVELISFYWFLFEHTTNITFYLILTIYHINMCQIFFCVFILYIFEFSLLVVFKYKDFKLWHK